MKVIDPVGATPAPNVCTRAVSVVDCPALIEATAAVTRTWLVPLATVNATLPGVLVDLL